MTDCEKCKKSVDTEVKYGKTDSGKLYHFECIPKEPAKPEEKKNPAEAENPPDEISITNRGITATGSDNSEVEKQQDKVIDQTYEVVGEDKIPRLAYTDRPKRHVLRTRIGFKGVTKDEVEKLKEKLKWYGATPNPPDEFENPPSAFSADTDKWYDDAIELETGREGENANLIALLNDKANKEILTFVIQALEKRYDSWSKSALAQARKIQDNGYKSEFRYQYGGTSLTGGKVSATSAFFSALQQALTYNTNPPTKENPVEIVLDATNPDREAIQKAYPEASMTDAVEFVLYAENDADLYRQRLQPWTVNFGRKMAAGKFDRKLAVGALADYLAKEVQTKYFKESGGGYSPTPEMTKATKLAFGELMLDSMMEEIQNVADDIKAGRRNKLGHPKKENPVEIVLDATNPGPCADPFMMNCKNKATTQWIPQSRRDEWTRVGRPGGYFQMGVCDECADALDSEGMGEFVEGRGENPPTEENPTDRQRVESKDNWVATYYRTRAKNYTALLHNIFGGFYWHDINYKGLFLSGTTSEYRADFLKDALSGGYTKLVKVNPKYEKLFVGDMPPESVPVPNPPTSENPGPYVPPDAPIRQSMSIGERVVTDADEVFSGIEPGWNGKVMAVGNGFYRVLWSSGPMSGRVTAIPPKYVIPPHMRANPPEKENPNRRIQIYNEVVTPESAVRGDIDEAASAFENEEGIPMASVAEAIKYLQRTGIIEAASTGPDWYQDEGGSDPYTGNWERTQYFLKGFSEGEKTRIFNALAKTNNPPEAENPFPRGRSNEEYMDYITKYFAKKGAMLTWNPDKTQFYGFATVEYKGHKWGLSASEAGQPDQMESFANQMDKVLTVVEDMKTVQDPFYSSISGRADPLFGKSAGRHIAFSAIVDSLRAQGKTIHSGNPPSATPEADNPMKKCAKCGDSIFRGERQGVVKMPRGDKYICEKCLKGAGIIKNPPDEPEATPDADNPAPLKMRRMANFGANKIAREFYDPKITSEDADNRVGFYEVRHFEIGRADIIWYGKGVPESVDAMTFQSYGEDAKKGPIAWDKTLDWLKKNLGEKEGEYIFNFMKKDFAAPIKSNPPEATLPLPQGPGETPGQNPPPGTQHVQAPNPVQTKPVEEKAITEADKKKYAEAIKHFEQFNMAEPGVIQKIRMDLPDKDTPAIALGQEAIDFTYLSDKEGQVTKYHHAFDSGRKAYFVRSKDDNGRGTILIPDVNILDWLYH